MSEKIVFIDTEVGIDSGKVLDSGACTFSGNKLHTNSAAKFLDFVKDSEYLCGHNIIHHDIPYIETWTRTAHRAKLIDTLYLSALLFPKRPYHKLVKDDKLQIEELNNPLNDSERAMELFADEINAFGELSQDVKKIYYELLKNSPEFSGFFDYTGFSSFSLFSTGLISAIRRTFSGRICANADLRSLISQSPVELAYALSLIAADDEYSITPPWLAKNYPKIENVLKLLRNTPCGDKNCPYCSKVFDATSALRRIFGFDHFRSYNGEPLQEMAAQAAIEGKSLLAVFPTGGGKSVTFQLPALLAGETMHGLTVVISPLQSLMKDQVDNLVELGIDGAVTINGMLDPIERKSAIDLAMNGLASILYISPESLRSKTIEKILLSRNVVRFVIDEAHCFSAWGQDFIFLQRMRKTGL